MPRLTVSLWSLRYLSSSFFISLYCLWLYLLSTALLFDGHLDVSSYLTVYGQAVNMRALTNTAKISILVMILSVLITFPLAWLIGRTDLPGRKKSSEPSLLPVI